MNNAKLTALLSLFRLELSISAGACVLLAELLALQGIPSLRQAISGFLSFFFISAAALILNDFFDIETDRINAPSRPLPSGIISKREAIVLSVVVALLGLLSGFAAGFHAFIVVLSVWIAGLLYNWKLKKYGFIGNLFVGFSVGMTFVYGGIVAGNPSEKSVLFLGVTAMLVNLGEEIAADVLDIEGDRQRGCRSLAVLLGPQQAMRLAAGVFVIVIAGSFFPFAFRWFDWPYFPPVIFFDGVIVYSVRNLLNHGRPQRINDIRRIYLAGSAMVLAFIVIRLVAG